jgi:hypothetical protein
VPIAKCMARKWIFATGMSCWPLALSVSNLNESRLDSSLDFQADLARARAELLSRGPFFGFVHPGPLCTSRA